MFIVYVKSNSHRWTMGVREDLYDGNNDEVLDLPAKFDTRAEAEQFVLEIRGLMHMGGSAEDFKIVEVAGEAFCDACQQHKPCSCDDMENDR